MTIPFHEAFSGSSVNLLLGQPVYKHEKKNGRQEQKLRLKN